MGSSGKGAAEKEETPVWLREITSLKRQKWYRRNQALRRKPSHEQRYLRNPAVEVDTPKCMPQFPTELLKPCVKISREERGERNAKLR